eukprot:TCONS_00062636-protein
MPVKFPCGICKKPVAKNHRAIQCDNCSYWVHIKCNNTTDNDYTKLISSDETWSCLKCIQTAIPFLQSSDEELKLLTQGNNAPHVTRNKQLSITRTKTVMYGSHNIANLITKDWNEIHPHLPSLDQITSKSTFKAHLHAYLLTKLASS